MNSRTSFITQEQFNTWLINEREILQEIKSTNQQRKPVYKYNLCDRIQAACIITTASLTVCLPCLLCELVCLFGVNKTGICCKVLEDQYNEFFADKRELTRKTIRKQYKLTEFKDSIQQLLNDYLDNFHIPAVKNEFFYLANNLSSLNPNFYRMDKDTKKDIIKREIMLMK